MNGLLTFETVAGYDANIRMQAGTARTSGSGIVYGLQLEQVPNSMELFLHPGRAVVNGSIYDLDRIYNNLVPPATVTLRDGLSVLVVLTAYTYTTTALNRYRQQVQDSTDTKFTVSVVDAFSYVPSVNDLVLGHCVYTVHVRNPDIDASQPVQLPVNVIGIYKDLPSACLNLFNDSAITPFTDTSSVQTHASVAVSTDTGTGVGVGTKLTVYALDPIQDPMTVSYTRTSVTGSESSGTLAGTGFVLDKVVGTTNVIWLSYNVSGTAYCVRVLKPASATGSVAVDVRVHAKTSDTYVDVTGTGSGWGAGAGTVGFTFQFEGASSHTVTLTWSSVSVVSASALWENVGTASFAAFTYLGNGYMLPASTRNWTFKTPSFTVQGNDASYYYSVIGIDAELDYSSRTFPFIRPVFSGVDATHRSSSTAYTSPRNIHGIGFDDIVSGSLPLHKQLFDSGFAVAPASVHGIEGVQVQEQISSVNVSTDYFGTVTGIFCNRYLVLAHIPLSVASLVDSATSAPIPYKIINDVVSLGTDFVGGDFAIYPVFVPANTYEVGARVTVAGAATAYQCRVKWVGNPLASTTPSASYFDTLVPISLTCSYFYIPDLEYVRGQDNYLAFNGNENAVIVTEGKVLPAGTATNPGFGTGPYTGIAKTMTLALSGTGTVVSSSVFVDAADLSVKKSNTSPLAIDVGNSQVQLYLTGTPAPRQLPALTGNIVITSDVFRGRVKLFYTYGVPDLVVFTTQAQTSTYTGDLDLTSAQLLDGVNYIPRSLWGFSKETRQVVIAPSVYAPGRTYKLVRRATETQRNMSGIVEVVGTGTKKEGKKARAYVTVSDFDRFNYGDSITVTIPGKQAITKTMAQVPGFTGFARGASANTTLTEVAQAFNTDPMFQGTGSYAYQDPYLPDNVLSFVAGADAEAGNSYKVTVQSQGNGLDFQDFYGGKASVWNLDDISGLGYLIQELVEPDRDGYFSIWTTGDLDTGADEKLFYRTAIVDDTGTGSCSGTIGYQIQDQLLDAAGWSIPTGWGGDNTFGFQHMTGYENALRHTFSDYYVDGLYRVSLTMYGHRHGSVTVSVGGITFSASDTVVVEKVFTAKSPLSIVPETDFDGSMVVVVSYTADTYRTDSETSVTVLVQGLDRDQNQLQETVTLDSSCFCDIQNTRVDNQYSNVRTSTVFSTITGWSVQDHKNVGTSKLTLLAESVSGTKDLFELCDIKWNGDGIEHIRDRRRFVDAQSQKPPSTTVSEALSSVAMLMQFRSQSSSQGEV